jgi:hypothetical protein
LPLLRLTAPGLIGVVILVSCGGDDGTAPSPSETPVGTGEIADRTAPATGETLVGAGDIADCGSPGAEATAALLDTIEGTVFTAGDNAYDDGSAADFQNCYEPSWGRHKARTQPAVGNHEYQTPGASDYFDYFGVVAGDRDKGYYSYDLGDWHIIVLNGQCSEVPCFAGSPQEEWLRADLAANATACAAAYWHQPRFSSGSRHGSDTSYTAFWEALYDHRVELVVNGHAHNYERFAPQRADGTADDSRGVRQFVVGTGGKNHRGFDSPIPNSEVRNDDTFGVLKLTLSPTSYEWEFVPEAGGTFTDSGSESCH